MESNATRIDPASITDLLAHAQPFEPDPPAVDGTCGRCGYRGPVYSGRYGGKTVRRLLGLQTGWMPSGNL